ncbi:hypothetical protein IMCC20628_04530 [Hoeflea sp. IMCC20628]|uniref:hypothetical protein n=1 Tax=Hoeflea sp. IMCC20628 TaxID=1620421 RepID=UPI00063BF304|nr:hypothetical protein [Hoeflea sp. IMCC20628]AKI03200.1 hypothetical protein IMCC20628_04530 [Hoeflea sp. IMCC20628]
MSETSAILTLSLNTFIRYYSLDPSKLVGEISRRMQKSGGYDFYGMLSDAIRAKIRGATEDEIQFILGRSNNPSEVSYNRTAFDVFMSKFGKKRGLAIFEKKGRIKLCDGELIILASPLFSIESSSGFSVYNVWATQNPALDRVRAGVGVHLLNKAFQKSAPNYDYKMFDAVEGKVFSTVGNTIPRAIDTVAKTIIDHAKNG